VLLRISMIVLLIAAITFTFAPWFLARAVAFASTSFVGLALQQYAWYTARTYTECWIDEGVPVVALVTLSAAILGGISSVLSMILRGLIRIAVLGTVHVGLLTCYRWQFWGSLFDGNEKLRSERTAY